MQRVLSVPIILFAFPLPSILHRSLSCSASSKAKPCRCPHGEWFVSRFDQDSEKRVEDGKREMWDTRSCPLPFSTDSLAAARLPFGPRSQASLQKAQGPGAQKSPDTPGSPEGNTEGPGTASSEPLLPS